MKHGDEKNEVLTKDSSQMKFFVVSGETKNRLFVREIERTLLILWFLQ